MIPTQIQRALAALLVMLPLAAEAEPVSVNRGSGQGLAFTHRNNCYVFLPNHVSERSPSLTISAGAPAVVGEARIFRRFPDLDLAVAHVTRGLEGRCGMPFGALPSRTDDLLSEAGGLTLVFVGYEGAVLRDRVDLVETLHDLLVVRPHDRGAIDYRQGVSGSFLMVGNVPVAMMLRAFDITSAEALRMDAIVERSRRLLEGVLGAPDEAAATALPPGAMRFRVASCAPEPLDPDAACGRLESGEGGVVMPAGRVAIFELEIDAPGGATSSLRMVELAAEPADDGAYAVPRSLRIEVDSSDGSRRRWRTFASGDMAPDGRFRVELPAGQYARRIRITVLSTWDPDLPVRIDRLVLR